MFFYRKNNPLIYALDCTQNDVNVKSKTEKKRKKVLKDAQSFALLAQDERLLLFFFFGGNNSFLRYYP